MKLRTRWEAVTDTTAERTNSQSWRYLSSILRHVRAKQSHCNVFSRRVTWLAWGDREVGNWALLIDTKFQSHRKGRGSGDTLHNTCIWLTVLHCKFRNFSEGKFYVMCFFPTIQKEWHYHIFKFRMITAAGERRQTPSRETCSVYWKHLGERGW